jgi:hypothetical protein
MATPNISEIEKINTENKAREIFSNKTKIIRVNNKSIPNNQYTQIGKPYNIIGKNNL